MVSNKNWAYSKNISMNWSLETYFGHFFFIQESPLVFELWKIRKIQIHYSFLIYVTPKLMDFIFQKISYTKILLPSVLYPPFFFNDSGTFIPLHIVYIFSPTWKFLTPSENLLLFFSDPLCYELWLMNLHKVHKLILKKGGKIGIRALIESNIFHKVSKL